MGFPPKQVALWLENIAKASGKPVEAAPRLAKPSKHRNVRVTQDGLKFDSKKEAERWWQLVMMEKYGKISELKRQVPFVLAVEGQRVCKYIADATYVQDGVFVVEDTKSEHSRKNPVFRLKRRLMLVCHNIEIREV